jgi:23S rRNA (uracil1939-C5)-methyltransferase
MILPSEGCNPLCPACTHRNLTIEESRSQKGNWLRKKLSAWQDTIDGIKVNPSSDSLHYRDKVCLAARWNGHEWLAGTRKEKEVIRIPDCPVHSERVRKSLHVILAVLPTPDLFPMVFFVQSGAQVTLVVKTGQIPYISWLTEEVQLRLADAGTEGLWIHMHPSAGNRVFLKTGWHLAWGSLSSQDGSGFHYGPTSFQQLIPDLHRMALDISEDFLSPGPETVTTDLYCGNGISLHRWRANGSSAVGVELSGEAVSFARVNAPEALIYRGKCSERIPQLDSMIGSLRSRSSRLLYVNPPRTGLEPEILDWITSRYKPVRIAYLSCSAGTLAKNLETLVSSGYRVRSLVPFDFFPYTRHVECLGLLERS